MNALRRLVLLLISIALIPQARAKNSCAEAFETRSALIDRLLEFYRSEGVVTSYVTPNLMRVHADGDSELARLASFLKVYGVNLGVDLEDFLAGSEAPRARLALQQGLATMYLGPNMAALRGRFSRQTSILHEFRHLMNIRDLRRKIPSPFYGRVDAVDGDLPGNRDFYAQEFPFDEIQTFWDGARFESIQLRRVARTLRDRESLRLQADAVEYRLIGMQALADRAARLASSLRVFLKASPKSVKYTYDGQQEVDVARIEWTYVSPRQMRYPMIVQIPLVEAASVWSEIQFGRSPKNAQLLEVQLKWLELNAEELRARAQQGQAILKRIRAERDPITLLRAVSDLKRLLHQPRIAKP